MDKIESVEQRRNKLERQLGISLKNIGFFSINESIASRRHCEQMIGVAQIPIGVAGPLKVNSKNVYIPLATTEGALVASVNRGCKAITQSGGATVNVEKAGTTRGPVFKINNIDEGLRLQKFFSTSRKQLQKIAARTNKFIKLKDIEGQVIGGYFFARLSFDTDRAMGMNMVTIASQEIADFIKRKLNIDCLSISGNYCVDKKASWINFIRGRGFKINAEITLSKKVLREVLKTDAQKFFDVWLGKCMIGSAASGSMGFNAHFSNIIAAIFIACGQDPGHVTEGSVGITTAEIIGENLKVGIYLPDVMIGTVGGGTGLATQKEALSIIGEDNLAEGIGGAVLAGEISLLASLSEGSLVKAHVRLARGGNNK